MWQTLRRQGIFIRTLAVVIFDILLLAVITPFILVFGSAWSLVAAGVAAGLCTAGAVLGLWIHHVFADPKMALTALLLSMAVNMGVPLAFGVAIHLYGGPLSESGFLYYLLFFYLLTLAMKTVLILPLPRQTVPGNHSS
ncbi:MAG: hypothetical protein ABSG67_05295 [Thermoguttaceae bacterium]|jgi:hypothetical protein